MNRLVIEQIPFGCNGDCILAQNIEQSIFAPIGFSVQANYFNLLDVYLSFPFIWLFGWPYHYNAMIYCIALCNGTAAFMFSQLFHKDKWVGLCAAILFMFSTPFLDAIESGRLIQSCIGVLPLGCMAIWRLHQKPTVYSTLFAAIIVGFNGWLYLYFGYAMAIIAVYLTVTERSSWNKWYFLLLFYIVSAGLAWFVVGGIDDNYILTTIQNSGAFPAAEEMMKPRYFANAGAILDHSIGVDFVVFSKYNYLSFLFVTFVVVGLWEQPNGHKLPLITFFVLLALGPYLQTDQGLIGLEEGELVSSPLYLWLYENMPMMGRMHWPERWLGVIISLLLPVVTIGLARFCQRKHWLFLFVLCGVCLDSIVKQKVPLTLYSVPECYLELRQQPEGLVLISPFLYADRSIVYQPIHQHKVVNPIGSSYDKKKWNDDYRDQILELQLVEWVRRYDQPMQKVKPFYDSYISEAQEAGILYLVHHTGYLKDALDDPSVSIDHGIVETRVRDTLIETLGTPSCEDSQIAIWQF
jgi:hypothetical protein